MLMVWQEVELRDLRQRKAGMDGELDKLKQRMQVRSWGIPRRTSSLTSTCSMSKRSYRSTGRRHPQAGRKWMKLGLRKRPTPPKTGC